MPRAELNQNPKGQPPGTLGKQAQAAAVAPDQSPAAQFSGTEQGESMFGAGQGTPSPSFGASPVMQPQVLPNPDQGFTPPKPEAVVPNVDPVSGLNYDEVLHGPTQRPLEPVTTGTAGPTGAQQKVSATLAALHQRTPSPDLQALLNAALSAGA